MEGFLNTEAKIKKVSFPIRGKMSVLFQDGRELLIPVSSLKSLKKVKASERNKPLIISEHAITWPGCDEVYHVVDLLGMNKVPS